MGWLPFRPVQCMPLHPPPSISLTIERTTNMLVPSLADNKRAGSAYNSALILTDLQVDKVLELMCCEAFRRKHNLPDPVFLN